MKILFVTNGYPTEVTPNLCPFIKSQVEDLNQAGLDVSVLSASQFNKFGYLRVLLQAFLKARAYEVVHFHHGLTFIFCFPLCIFYPNKKYFVSFLNNIEYEYEELRSVWMQYFLVKFTKWLIRISSIWVIEKNSRFTREFKRYSVLPNGVNLGFYKPISMLVARQKLGLSVDSTVFLFVSSKSLLRNQKRIDRFNDLVKSSDGIVALYMSGVNKDESLYYYSAANYLIVTSELEGSPNAVKESIACGTAVLTLDVGDVKSILRGEANSRIFSTFSDMKRFVETLGSPQLVLAEKFDGHTILRQNGYDSENVASRLIQLYSNT